jgi:hypothetical protein
MNDTMSLLLATGILAVGGLGLFMYKSDSHDKNDNEKDEDSMFDFDLRSFFGNSNDKEDDDEEEYNEDEEPEVYEPPKRSKGSKTKSVRKISGTKRRY